MNTNMPVLTYGDARRFVTWCHQHNISVTKNPTNFICRKVSQPKSVPSSTEENGIADDLVDGIYIIYIYIYIYVPYYR